ncbi:hypothetical protein CPE01_27990 [Cellulomonas persica]|uniref:Uncharacterized protein n=1 Tax=Cellulomonas persica TaxID=76861 RepID=A0A510UX18_9CELL|nr:hypothetical protein CPE01_27990 [Cellulomonas persica]
MSRASRSPALQRWVGAFLASAVAVVVVGLAGLVVGEATASAVGTTYAYDTAAYVYAAPARLLPPDTVARDVRGSPSGPGAASWGRSVSVGGDVVAANTAGADIAGARFAQSSYSEMFSSGGRFAGQSIDDVAGVCCTDR